MTKISVIVVTYNHKKYISKAVDSILVQKGEFEPEIFIGDDCSDDGTSEIVKQYADKHPDIIHAVLRTKNIGARANMVDLINRCSGKYVAFLDGDDYWIDEYKLAKQMKVLDENQNIAAVYGKKIVVNSENERNEKAEEFLPTFSGEKYTLKDFEKFILPGQTSTVLHRKAVLDKFSMEDELPKKYIKHVPGDRVLALFLLSQGEIISLPDKLCAYRWQMDSSSGTWSSKNDIHTRNTQLKFLFQLKELEKLGRAYGLKINYDDRRIYEFKKARFNGKANWKNRLTILMQSRNKIRVLYKLIYNKLHAA